MLDIILTPIIVVAAMILMGIYSKRYIENTVFDVVNDLKAEVIEIAPKLMDNLAGNIIDKFKFSLMGTKSGKVRSEKSAQKKLLTEVIQQQNPLISMIVDRVPELKDMLTDNPDALMQLLPLAQKFLGSGSSGGGSLLSRPSTGSPSTPPPSHNNKYWRCV